jgi:hypothetical protein
MKSLNPLALGGFAAMLAGGLFVISDLLRLYVVNLANQDIVSSLFLIEKLPPPSAHEADEEV